MAARQVGGRPSSPPVSSSGRRPAKAPDDVAAVQRGGEGGRDDVEQEADLGLGRLGHVGHRALDRLVGEPDVDGAVGLGQHHHEAVARPGHRAEARATSRPGTALGAQHQVGAAAGPQPHAGVEVAGPHAGGVDDGARADLAGPRRWSRRAARRRCRSRSSTRARVRTCAPCAAAVRARVTTRRASSSSRPSQRQHRAAQARRGGARARRARVSVAERWRGPGSVSVAGVRAAAQQVAGRAGRPRVSSAIGGRDAGGERHHVGHRRGEVGRGDLHQHAALDRALVGDADLAVRRGSAGRRGRAWRTTARCRRRGRGRRRPAPTGRGWPRRAPCRRR